MNFQGGKLQGFRYGQLSPKDNNGLQLWMRATDGVTFSRGNRMNNVWRDQSSYNRLLALCNNQGVLQASNNSSVIVNTAWGLAYYTSDVNYSWSAYYDGNFHDFMINGTPFTIFLVTRTGSTLGLAPQVNWAGSGLGGSAFLQLASAANGGIPIRATNHASMDLYGYMTTNQNNIYELTCYGYNNGTTPNRRFLINNILRTTGSFSASPVGLTSRGIFSFIAGQAYLYEIIIYNHAGKTAAKINEENSRIYNDYILKRYPGFIS